MKPQTDASDPITRADSKEADGPIRIACGDLSLELAPHIGGCVASFRKRMGDAALDVLRPMSAADLRSGNVQGSSMFPLLPYANRVAGGEFRFRGKLYKLALPGHGADRGLHGSAWRSAWRPTIHPHHIDLMLEHRDEDDPFAYDAIQRFKLDADGLMVGLEVVHRGRSAMPFGVGLHPWFLRSPSVTVHLAVSEVWLEDEQYLPTVRTTIPKSWDFASPRHLPETWMNNCFTGWNGTAEVQDSARGLGVRILAQTPFAYLHVYSDPQLPAFCLEPQTHAIGALRRIDDTGDNEGLTVLEPGEKLATGVRFEIFDLRRKGRNGRDD